MIRCFRIMYQFTNADMQKITPATMSINPKPTGFLALYAGFRRLLPVFLDEFTLIRPSDMDHKKTSCDHHRMFSIIYPRLARAG